MARELTTVSLYTGAGGMDHGFEAAGFRTAVAIEFDGDCCATLSKSRPWPLLAKDIHAVKPREILDTAALSGGSVDLLIGGPPCQPFSKSGYWASGDSKRLDDPRAGTLAAYMNCVETLLPKVFCLENVHGISYSGKEEGFLLLQRMTDRINKRYGTSYELSWEVINTADYGIPQMRRRFFLVAHRDGGRFRFPPSTHRDAEADQQCSMQLDTDDLESYVTAWDAIGHLDHPRKDEDLKVRGRWADLLPSIPEGHNYLWHTNRGGGVRLFGWRTRFWTFLLKLAKNRPSWTLQAQPGPAIGPFHWLNRRLSVREMKSLQTFPEDAVIVGNRGSVQRQLGNAVPSLMTEILGRAIASQFFGIIHTGPYKLEVKLNRPIPRPESVGPVPERLYRLIGDHPDHPGEGRGAFALVRQERPTTTSTATSLVRRRNHHRVSG